MHPQQYFSKFSKNSKAIFFTILTCFFVSVLVAIVRHLSTHFHIFFIIMMRNVFAFSLFIPLLLRRRNNLFKTNNLRWHILRNVNGLAAMMVWFYTVTLIPLPEAVSITFIVPIITTVAAILLFKEKVNANLWKALFIGFIGILIITRPGFHEFKFAYFTAFIATILWSISNLIIKRMTRTDKPETIVAYMSLITFVLSVPFGITQLAPINSSDIFWLFTLGLVSNLAHMSMSTAYSKADLSVLQPFDFMRLIFTAIISYFAFDESLDIWSAAGSLVILAGTIFVAPKGKKKYTEIAAID